MRSRSTEVGTAVQGVVIGAAPGLSPTPGAGFQAKGSGKPPGSSVSRSRACAATLCATRTSYLVATTDATEEKSRRPLVNA